jgi:hypothetical protein
VIYCYEGRLSDQGQFLPGSTAAGGGVTSNSLAAHSVEHTSVSAVTGEDSQSTAPDLVTGTSFVSCLGNSARSAGAAVAAPAFLLGFALVFSLVPDSSQALACPGLSISEIPADLPAAQVVHDFRYGVLTLQEARAVLEALPVSDPVEQTANAAALCFLQGFQSW